MAPFYDHQVGRFEAPRLDHHEIHLAARRARARTFAELFGALFRGLATLARAAVGFVRCAGRGAALMPPQGHYRRTTPARLTGGCE